MDSFARILPRRAITIIAVATVATACARDAWSQSYPVKPIRVVVPTSAGGGTDMIARALAHKLNESWGQPVVTDNRPGATGAIGMEVVANAVADGYTLVVCTSAMLTINPNLYARLRYDPIKSFAPVTLAASSPHVLVLHPRVTASTVKELIAFMKANPRKLNYSSSGNGSATHLAGELFDHMAGVQSVHIPYKGGGPAITDLLGGQIQMRFSSLPPLLPHVRAGRLRALAVTSATRFSMFPELPTVAETVPGYKSDIWYGVLGPAGMPAAIVAKLHAEMTRHLHTAEFKSR